MLFLQALVKQLFSTRFNLLFLEFFMTRLSNIVIAAALTLPLAAVAQVSVTTASSVEAGIRAKGGEIEVRATVVELDKVARTAVLKGPRGDFTTVNVPAEVKNFDQVSVGDVLVIRYVTAIAATLEPVSNKGIRERVESSGVSAADAGAMPGAIAGRKVEILAQIKAIDTKAGTVTLRGATRSVTIGIPANMDVSKLKVGGEVRAVYVEALVMNVERVVAPVAAPAKVTKPAPAVTK
jgi:hypothetical protein